MVNTIVTMFYNRIMRPQYICDPSSEPRCFPICTTIYKVRGFEGVGLCVEAGGGWSYLNTEITEEFHFMVCLKPQDYFIRTFLLF